jgi:ABC-type transport system involved in cytochrome bd biosynthesis fused ATPase/permease subunit
MGRTTLLVAHDALTLSLADRVYRVERGTLTEVQDIGRSLSA